MWHPRPAASVSLVPCLNPCTIYVPMSNAVCSYFSNLSTFRSRYPSIALDVFGTGLWSGSTSIWVQLW